MKEYGIINENGFLQTKMLQERNEQYKDINGVLRSRTITIEEQEATVKQIGWKPVDLIDNAKLKADYGFVVRIRPIDKVDRISFEYEQVVDAKWKQRKIDTLKSELAAGDYKITKCYEASLLGEPLPYDIKELHAARQSIRDKISELEKKV